MLLDTSSWPSTCPLSPLFSTSGFKVFFLPTFYFQHCERDCFQNSSLSGSFQSHCAGCCQKERWYMGAPQFLQIHQKLKYCKGSWTSWKKEARIGGKLEKRNQKLEMKTCSQVRRAEAVVASYLCYNSLELDPASLRCPVGIRGAKTRAAG